MVFVTINSEVETWVTRQRDPSDSWDQGDTDGRVSNVTAWLSEDAREWYSADSMRKEFPDTVTVGTILYAVVADYSSGCTFGRDGGHCQILDTFVSSQEAEDLMTAALATPEDTKWSSRYSFTFNDREYHRSWVGYFESLNSLDIWQVEVQGTASNYLNPGTTNYKVGR